MGAVADADTVNVNRRTTQIKNLEENMSALDVNLSEEEVAEIRKIVDAAEVHERGIRKDSQQRPIEIALLWLRERTKC